MANDDLIPYDIATGVGGKSSEEEIPYEMATTSGEAKPGILTRAPDEGYMSGLGKGTATATIRGLAQIPGMFGNIREMGKYLSGRALEAAGVPKEAIERGRKEFAGPAELMPTGEEIAKPILGVTGGYEPESYAGKLGMAGLETGISMLGPGAGAVKIGERALERGVPKLGFEALKETAKAAPAGFVPGIAGQAAYDVTGDPLYAFGASILAGGAQPFAKAATEKAIRPVAEDIPFFGRAYEGERRRMAGEQLEKLSSEPEKLREALWPPQGPAPQEIIPGSKPTLGQLTGDVGLLEAERAAKTVETEPFNVLEAEQNAARRQALQAIPSDVADSMSVPELVTRQNTMLMRGLDNAENSLQTRAVQLADQLGQKVPPEQLGDMLRKSIEDLKKQVSEKVSELYKAVDPQGKISLVATPIRESVGKMVASVDPYGVPLNANETRIYDKISAMPDVMPFRSLVELDKDINQSMKEAAISGQGESRGRLIEAKKAVQDAINKAIENQEKYEKDLVARKEMAPEDTMESRVRQWTENFYKEKTGEKPAPQAPEAEKPAFDVEAADRLRGAKEAHKLYATTYKAEPIAGSIKTTGFNGQYQIPAGAVPGRAIVAGPRGYEAAQAFLNAADHSADAVFAMKESLLNDLRGRVKNNVLGINELNAWKNKYDGALRAMEEAEPGFSSKFDNAAIAADNLAEFGAQRKASEEAFQKSSAAKFLGATAPEEVEARLGQIIRNEKAGVSQMRDLVNQIKTEPAALEGLRKAAADWIVRKMSTAAEAGTTQEKLLAGASFQKMVRDSAPVLEQLFTPEQMNTLRAVAKDLERADRSVQATRIKGSPGTAKDMKQFFKKGTEKLGDVGLLFGMFEIVKDAAERGGIKGAATVGLPLAGAYGFKHWRGSGIQKVQNIVRDAILDPSLARQLLMEVPRDKIKARSEIVGKMIQRGLYQPSETRPKRDEYQRGGKVGYPAKKLSPIEKAAAKAYNDIANETKPLMEMPDEQIAHALNMARGG